ncbi:MAG: DNA repair protein RecN [Acidovorax sp.]
MALRRIELRDFVIVQSLEIDVHGGFTVLTGETGAGKSILIDALQLALGARADAGVVREGARQADICAEFDSPASLAPWLEEGGFDPQDTLLLRRVVDAQGKSRAWINGSPATATQLRTVGEQLLDIHGQHAWQSLMRPEAVRGLLDAYAGVNTAALRQRWAAWRAARQTLAAARARQDTALRERERLQWQIGEVDKLAPAAHEWDELNTQHTRLSHAQALIDTAESALGLLEDDENGAHARLARAHHLLAQQQHLDPEFQALAEVLASALAQADDASHSLHAYLRRAELDPGRLAELDQRLSQWMALARRYKRPPEDLPATLEGWKQELRELDAAADLAQLEATESECGAAYQKEAQALSHSRAKAAPRLSRAITEAMQGLGMAGGQFHVAIEPAEPGPEGLDAVGFLVAGHPGATPRPIGKVASGGELSRISLAIAVTTSQLGAAPTLIFDEVDSGVGGAVAETVGRLMRRLGRDRQVLAVTHLPQVAACADQHLLVAKRRTTVDKKAVTTSTVAPVQHEERVREVARMLGGEKMSDTTLAHAKEMLGATP